MKIYKESDFVKKDFWAIVCPGYGPRETTADVRRRTEKILQEYRKLLERLIDAVNTAAAIGEKEGDKDHWCAAVKLMPMCFNQKRTAMLSYETLANIYRARRSHKLAEWRDFCKWIESLPYSELITLREG